MKIFKDHIWFGQYYSNFANYGISHSHGQLREVFGKDCTQYREACKYLSLNDISELAHFQNTSFELWIAKRAWHRITTFPFAAEAGWSRQFSSLCAWLLRNPKLLSHIWYWPLPVSVERADIFIRHHFKKSLLDSHCPVFWLQYIQCC